MVPISLQKTGLSKNCTNYDGSGHSDVIRVKLAPEQHKRGEPTDDSSLKARGSPASRGGQDLRQAQSSQLKPPGLRAVRIVVVIGLFIWARIDDQRQRSFVTGYPCRPPGFQNHEDIRGSMHAGGRQRVADGGQTSVSVSWRLSRSVIDSVALAGAEFARNADSMRDGLLGMEGGKENRSAHSAASDARYYVAMSQSPELVVYGKLSGPVECSQPTKWGCAIIKPSSEGDVIFEIAVPAKNDSEAEHLVGLIPPAMRAFIALGWAVWVNPVITGYEFNRSDGTSRVGSQLLTSWRVQADLSKAPDPGARAAGKIQETVLDPSDARLVELISLFALGLEGTQATALITGLWVFANVIEEEAIRSNIDHAGQMAAGLRRKGYAIAPDPTRKPGRIRAAALHPTPRDPLPTDDEVRWLMDIARSYLADRASRILTSASLAAG